MVNWELVLLHHLICYIYHQQIPVLLVKAVGHIRLTNTTTANEARIRVGYKLTYGEMTGDNPGNISQEFAIFETNAPEEAGYVAINGNTTAIGNAGDNATLRWYDEDSHPGPYWYNQHQGLLRRVVILE